ncbi:MAG: TRAP transporter TatT component family protein [Acidobacteria bacterium]|nr:TRAP transporter TatT component family protein [Acidobacteriota bacterium]
MRPCSANRARPQGRLAVISALLLGLFALSVTGCSIKKMAVNSIGDALSESGETYASDNDPELIREALPFSLKLVESILAESPRHRGLLLAACSGFMQYAYAFIVQDADAMEQQDFARASEMRLRARNLFLRARDYGLRGLETRHAGIAAALNRDPLQAVRTADLEDVPLLFWSAASWGMAIILSKDEPDLIVDQLLVEALIDRALELDEAYSDGAIHSFLIMYEPVRRGAEGDPLERSRGHYERAMELSAGFKAGPLVSMAESVCVAQRNHEEFRSLLLRALAIDADAKPEYRLENLIMQRRARWLLSRIDELFLIPEE